MSILCKKYSNFTPSPGPFPEASRTPSQPASPGPSPGPSPKNTSPVLKGHPESPVQFCYKNQWFFDHISGETTIVSANFSSAHFCYANQRYFARTIKHHSNYKLKSGPGPPKQAIISGKCLRNSNKHLEHV